MIERLAFVSMASKVDDLWPMTIRVGEFFSGHS